MYIFDLIIFFFFLFRISSILVKTLWSPPIKSSLTATSRRKSSSSARFFQVRFHTNENDTQQIVYEIVLSKYCVWLNNKGVLIYLLSVDAQMEQPTVWDVWTQTAGEVYII